MVLVFLPKSVSIRDALIWPTRRDIDLTYCLRLRLGHHPDRNPQNEPNPGVSIISDTQERHQDDQSRRLNLEDFPQGWNDYRPRRRSGAAN